MLGVMSPHEAQFDVIVVGGGHAGAEAAWAAANLGARVALVTLDPRAIGVMSCNPAIGGLAKGQVVREIDALGGAMARVADRTGIQFKVLNGSRGPAVRGLRCQSDKVLYAAEMTAEVRSAPRLTVAAGVAAGFHVEEGRLTGLVLEDGSLIHCRAAVVTTGTFLRGLVHVGDTQSPAGRWNEPPAVSLSTALAGLGLRLGRMKTGTPPRVARASLDVTAMREAPGDENPLPFSRLNRELPFPRLPQVLCWLTYTGEEVHDLLRENLHRSPLYSGRIVGRGPRYCPSIEDKVVRFPDRERHQIFVEPEGLTTDWMYLNGLSMSLPVDVQERVVRALPGCRNAVFLRPAYAVEYDVVYPEQLDDTLEVRALQGLFLAGQINGTSGYEEAAGQGLVAGVNAAFAVAPGTREAFVLRRDEAYIGVMIDDLVTLGTEEPYRLMTSRAEHRLLLGPDSAYRRLLPRAVAAGLVPPSVAEPLLEREERLVASRSTLEETRVSPSASVRAFLARRGIELNEQVTLAGLLRRPEVGLETVDGLLRELGCEAELRAMLAELEPEDAGRLVDEVRYDGFLRKEEDVVRRLRSAEERTIPAAFAYRGVPGLSAEAVEKLDRHRPRTIGQAGRIPGVTPAAVTIVLARILARTNAEASGVPMSETARATGPGAGI